MHKYSYFYSKYIAKQVHMRDQHMLFQSQVAIDQLVGCTSLLSLSLVGVSIVNYGVNSG